MKKILLTILLVAPLISQGAMLTVMDALFTKGMKGIDNVLVKNSVDATSSFKIKKSLEAAMIAISKVDGAMVNHSDFSALVKSLPDTDPSIMRLKALLAKDSAKLDGNEIGELVNAMTYVASSKGANKAKLLTCNLCAGDALADLGIHSIARVPIQGTTDAKLSKLVPTSNVELNKYLNTKFRRLKLGDYLEQSVGKVTKDNKRSLAMFLGYLEKGSVEEKHLAKTIVKFSKDETGKPRLLEHNTLWTIFDYIPQKKMGKSEREEFIVNFANMLDEISEEAPINGNRGNNLKAYFERRAKENPSLQKYLDDMNDRQFPCWGL